jgi:hypothetical protein
MVAANLYLGAGRLSKEKEAPNFEERALSFTRILL